MCKKKILRKFIPMRLFVLVGVLQNLKHFMDFGNHVKWYLWKTTFNKNPPPQKKKWTFLGGILFWIFSSIFESGWDKKFWRDFGIEWTLLATNYRLMSARNPQLNFQKYGYFRYFGKFSNFLSSIYDFAPKLRVNHSKCFFWDSLDPKD